MDRYCHRKNLFCSEGYASRWSGLRWDYSAHSEGNLVVSNNIFLFNSIFVARGILEQLEKRRLPRISAEFQSVKRFNKGQWYRTKSNTRETTEAPAPQHWRSNARSNQKEEVHNWKVSRPFEVKLRIWSNMCPFLVLKWTVCGICALTTWRHADRKTAISYPLLKAILKKPSNSSIHLLKASSSKIALECFLADKKPLLCFIVSIK